MVPATTRRRSKRVEPSGVRRRKRAAKRARSAVLILLSLVALAAVAWAVRVAREGAGENVADQPVAPEFTLQDSSGKDVSLGDYRGKPVVVVFFRTFLANSSRKQLAEIQKVYPDIRKLGAEVLAISVDDPQQNKAGKEDLGLSFPVLSDGTHAVGEAYAVYNLLGDGADAPAVFVLDRHGRIRWRFIGRNVLERPPIRKVLAELHRAAS